MYDELTKAQFMPLCDMKGYAKTPKIAIFSFNELTGGKPDAR